MKKSFLLEIVTPDRMFYTGEAESLILNTPTGKMGILCHTLPLVSVLSAGIIRIGRNERWMEAVNSEGFISVMYDRVTVLTQSCAWPYEIDDRLQELEIEKLDEKERKAKSLYEYKVAKAQLAVRFAHLRIKNKDD